MSAKDVIHQPVKNALMKDGWHITDDPFTLEYEGTRVYVDLGAERFLAAEREGKKIAVEIKSFLGPSIVQDIGEALGKYILYLSFLKKTDPSRRLFLAISHITYANLQENKAIQMLLEENHVAIIVVNINLQEIVAWIQN